MNRKSLAQFSKNWCATLDSNQDLRVFSAALCPLSQRHIWVRVQTRTAPSRSQRDMLPLHQPAHHVHGHLQRSLSGGLGLGAGGLGTAFELPTALTESVADPFPRWTLQLTNENGDSAWSPRRCRRAASTRAGTRADRRHGGTPARRFLSKMVPESSTCSATFISWHGNPHPLLPGQYTTPIDVSILLLTRQYMNGKADTEVAEFRRVQSRFHQPRLR